MTIQTDYYGLVEYEEEDLITLPEGFFGFPDLKRYLPLLLSEEDDSMILFQSVERPEVAFVLINPAFLLPDYSPSLTPEELAFLGAEDSGELSYFVICVIHDDYMDNTVNMKCPLSINPQTKIGMQVIMEQSEYDFRQKISSFPGISRPDDVSEQEER